MKPTLLTSGTASWPLVENFTIGSHLNQTCSRKAKSTTQLSPKLPVLSAETSKYQLLHGLVTTGTKRTVSKAVKRRLGTKQAEGWSEMRSQTLANLFWPKISHLLQASHHFILSIITLLVSISGAFSYFSSLSHRNKHHPGHWALHKAYHVMCNTQGDVFHNEVPPLLILFQRWQVNLS